MLEKPQWTNPQTYVMLCKAHKEVFTLAVFRIEKTQNYSVMSNYHFKEKDMSLKSKGLLSLMLSLPDSWDYNISGLVRLSKDGKDSVMSALAELEKFGYLRRERTKDDGGKYSGIIYHIFEEPQRENQVAEIQNSVEENAEKSNSEKPPQLSTNSINHLDNQITNKEREINELLSEIEDSELRELYNEYISQRIESGNSLSPKGLKMMIARGYRLSNFDLSTHRAIVETSIINNWANLYEPRNEEKLGRNGHLEDRKKYYLGK